MNELGDTPTDPELELTFLPNKGTFDASLTKYKIHFSLKGIVLILVFYYLNTTSYGADYCFNQLLYFFIPTEFLKIANIIFLATWYDGLIGHK